MFKFNRKAQLDTILQKNFILSQENSAFKSQLDQFPEQINSMISNSLIKRIKKVEINKKMPRLHIEDINKIISYGNNTKYITCSDDKTIIIRNCEDNAIINTLIDHKEAVNDILLLSDGRLASSSEDNTIKIWNVTNGNCEQTLIGHSYAVCCLLELPNSILISGSADSSIGIWEISQNDKKEIEFYHQVQNELQKQVNCMALISVIELAVSSDNNINIYSFENVNNNTSFNIIKILKGHNDWVSDMKLMKNSNDLLISCSADKDCRLWSISKENCLNTFKGHSDRILSMQIISDTIFVSAGAEIIFWNIESAEAINSIKPDGSIKWILSGQKITCLIKNDRNELVFAGGHNFIGLIKI